MFLGKTSNSFNFKRFDSGFHRPVLKDEFGGQSSHLIFCRYGIQIWSNYSDLTRPHPNGGLVREIPLFQGNLGW